LHSFTSSIDSSPNFQVELLFILFPTTMTLEFFELNFRFHFLSNWCEICKIQSQGAFRKDRWIQDHIFMLHGICSLAKSSKKPLYIAFLDLSKAFDRVWREGLLAKLWESGIQGKPLDFFELNFRFHFLANLVRNLQESLKFSRRFCH
jgi:hypothetical protein